MLGFAPYLVAMDNAADAIAQSLRATGTADVESICASCGLYNLSNDELDYIQGRVNECF